MKKWESELNGKYLREMVNNEADGYDILREIYRLVKVKLSLTKDEDLTYDFKDLYYVLESDVEIGKEELVKWLKEEEWNLTDLVNDRLSQFYDLCDKYRIWVVI